ncbi:MAG: Na+:H+ antiporter, NhaA family [Actinomycetota bacterium]|nr:Na+:H+ antiporter, NhaA family [Actinomycetota bacterium]
MTAPQPRAREFLRRLSLTEYSYVTAALRQETVGGALLLVATVVALVWANSPLRNAYADLQTFTFGPAALHLHLSAAAWAGDGLLAVFFFVAGLELKRELVVGSLRRPAEALLPVGAALCGMAVPALIYLAVTAGDPGAARGWAVPTATDIAFCLAVLAVTGPALPAALRAFLLTLAVVDDLVAIVIIGVFYSESVHIGLLVAAVLPLAAYAVLQRRRVDHWALLLPLAVLAWCLTHAAGVHPTVAAVAVGLLTRVRRDDEAAPSPVERFEHVWRPLSAGVAVPVFALLSVGIAVSPHDLSAALHDRAALGVVAARIVGKTIGVFGGTYLLARLTAARLNPDLDWADVFGMAVLTGIGFAVPLLVSDVVFGPGSARDDRVTAGILVAALLAALLGAVLLRSRHWHYRLLYDEESRDDDHDGVPDVYQRPAEGHTGDDHG